MTKFLPQRDVKVRADRTGPARLTAAERRALHSVKDENLRRVLGEMLLRSRDVQENFEAIEGLFPIQPENVANALREPEEEESVQRGQMQIVTFTWAKNAGTNLQKLITQEFEPTFAYLFAIANGPAALSLSGAQTFSGVSLASTGMVDNTAKRPTIQAFSTSMAAGQSLGEGPGPRRLVLNRAAEANTKNAYEIALVLVRTSQSLENSSGANGNTESGGGVLSVGALSAFLHVEMIPSIYTRASEKLPTARSATPVFEKLVEYGTEGKKGTAGAQILLPTLAEREAEGSPTLSWTFPDPGATAERRIYETTSRLL